tara:strand:- start:6763 stop:7950 length:1188 start_codon:yes stop_codon:yes gene_type:complete
MKKLIILFIFLFLSNPLILKSQETHEEMRGIFVPTIFNISWPSSSDVESQKSELIDILDTAVSNNYNSIFLQIRPAGDAFYKSDIDPWSNWLTSEEGKSPNPLWDPLEFAINESHKRGLELHAWINPYRVKYGKYKTDPNNVINKHPDWVFSHKSKPDLIVLDPGLPEVRDYIVKIVEDISIRYDIDGIHFDDYFYLYDGMSNQDQDTYQKYNTNDMTLGDWRRDNVNKMVYMVYDSIQVINKKYNKNIIFGISPFGIWKYNVPKGIKGSSSYYSMYCDPIDWMKKGKVDYIAPQLYWRFGGNQDYEKLSQWWNDQSEKYGVHLYVSQRYYGMESPNWSPQEIQRQIDKNRSEGMKATHGQIVYRYNEIRDNHYKINDYLNNDQYKHKANIPKIK